MHNGGYGAVEDGRVIQPPPVLQRSKLFTPPNCNIVPSFKIESVTLAWNDLTNISSLKIFIFRFFFFGVGLLALCLSVVNYCNSNPDSKSFCLELLVFSAGPIKLGNSADGCKWAGCM